MRDPVSDRESLYAQLPADAAAVVRAALATATAPTIERKRYHNMNVTMTLASEGASLDAAFTAVEFPAAGQPIPLASELTPPQRALAELLAAHVIAIGEFAIPKAAWVRRRWLGLDPASVLERTVTFTIDGEPRTAPLWRALAELGSDGQSAMLSKLPIAEQLEAFGDLMLGAYGLEVAPLELDLATVTTEGAEWAPRYADRLIELFDGDALQFERGDETSVSSAIKQPLAVALLRAGIPIEPRWDHLLLIDASRDGLAMTRELLAAVPEPRRVAMVLRSIETNFPRVAVYLAMTFLDDVPAPELVATVIARAHAVDGEPARTILERLAARCAGRPALLAMVTPALAALPPPLGLQLGRVLAPIAASELTPLQIAQCARGNEMIQGVSDNWVDDESIRYLQLGIILDAAGDHVYDFAICMEEDGVVFRANTTEPVAVLCQDRLDCRDPALKEGLQLAIAAKSRRELP